MKRRLVVFCLIASIQTAHATVFERLSDRQLVDRSDAVVIGIVQDAIARDSESGIVTDYHLAVEEVLKGSAAGAITITEVGGRVGTRFAFITDSAVYSPGERVLAFLKRRNDGTYFTTSMALGKFTFDGPFLVRSAEELQSEPLRLGGAFESFIRGANVNYLATSASAKLHIAPNGNAKQYALTASGFPVRWFSGAVTFLVNGSMSFATNTAISAGMASWTNDPSSNITLTNGGSTAITAPDQNDNKNVILLGYTGSNQGFCDGTSACTIGAGNVTNSFDGDTWVVIDDADIFVHPTVSQAQFASLITHEFGHAIGIRHSDTGVPSSSSAIMASSVPAAFGTTLQQWDKEAVATIYGTGLCPQITNISGGGPVPSGSTITLTVTAGGTYPLHYQWYDGTTGITTTPVGSDSAQFTTPPITTTRNFWVRVSNSCGGGTTADSATVTLTPQACQKPEITLDPLGQTIASGATASLLVGASGSAPLTFQWYQGQPPDTSNPILGANASQFTTPPLTQTTSYWVLVSNGCGSAQSRAATITIPGSCVAPSFTRQPASVTIDSGHQTFLTASASNATPYQWFKGSAGDESTPVVGLSPSNARFVNQLYIDLLGRQSDAAAGAFISGLDAAALTRSQVAVAVLASAEYRTDLLTAYSNAYLHRNPTPSEIAFWLPAFAAAITDEQVAAQILGSTEYFALAGGTNALWVVHGFNDILGRSPSPTEVTAFSSALGSTSRSALALTLLTSPEERLRFVQSAFVRFLRRSPSTVETSSLLSAMSGGSTDEQIIALLVASSEYFNFGTVLPTGSLSSTTTFWVKATNSDGKCSTNSATATVTIPSCTTPVITQQPQDVTVVAGETATIAVIAVGGATYQWYNGNSGDPNAPVTGATSALFSVPVLNPGPHPYWVKVSNACGSTNSSTVTVTANCAATKAALSAPPSVMNATPYTVSWSGNPQAVALWELDESTSADFSTGVKTFSNLKTTSQLIAAHSEATANTRFYYRVRAFPACGGSGINSNTASTLVSVPLPPALPSYNFANPRCGSTACSITQNLFIPGFNKSGKQALDADTFSVTSDKSFITVTPASGPLPPEGATVTLTINTSDLSIGSSQATLAISKTEASAKGVLGTTTSTVPISISLVTPVTTAPKDSNIPPNTVLVPAIAHADGINSQFQSDVRITNTAPQPITYLLTYTPSNTDGTQAGKQTSITIDAGETKALDDVVKNWYGSGTLGEGGVGTLEIRPLNYAGKTGVNVSFATVASSRTYNTTSNGTFGQYIPAIPLIDFLAKSDVSRISLQQVAQSSAYRTNLGFVEGSGHPVDFVVSLLDDKNTMIASRSYSLRAFEHQQTSMGSFFPGISINDGRIEVQVTSEAGKVTAYASVLDNTTSDPLLVFPVDPSKVSTTRFVVPGVAELNNGAANFHTDMRVYNGGSTATNVTLTFPANPSFPPVQKQLAAGEVWAIDNVIPTLWHGTGGGAVVATTDNSAPIVVTARTYSRRDDGGTFGQFIPGVTASDSVGAGDQPLQVVQLEQSPAFRSNLGLVEVTGNPVTLDVAAYTPESKIAAHTQVTLGPGQFTQLGSVFAGMGFTSNVYNGRIAVTAIGGTGRAAAYGSVVDNRTQDPTYVPAH